MYAHSYSAPVSIRTILEDTLDVNLVLRTGPVINGEIKKDNKPVELVIREILGPDVNVRAAY